MCALLSDIDLLAGLRPVRVSAGEVVYPPGGTLGPRWQHDVQLVLLHTGSARITIDDGAPSLHGADAVVLLPPGHRERFDFDTTDETHHSWVQVGLGDPPGDVGALPDDLGALPRELPASGALTELVREAVAVARTPISTATPLLAALATAALLRYVGEAESRVRGTSDTLGRARRFLHSRVTDPDVDLGRVAAAAHVTPAHLVRHFRAELGITPMAYLWERRVATGVDLLTNTGLPVGEIAARCGFKSVYHFSRRVKQRTGSSPTALRRGRWGVTNHSAGTY
jgi:AraC family transcriptional regulator of arabinose operon